MNKQWRIKWKSTVTGKTGQGKRMFTESDAKAIASEANRKHPALNHWID